MGAGANIGCNALGVNEVPANATAVGIPARMLEEGQADKGAQAAKSAKSPAFTAYAVSNDNDQLNPEALAKTLQQLQDHSAAQDAKLAALTLQLQALVADSGSDTEVAKAFDIKHGSTNKR